MIGSEWVLTAAHCIVGDPSRFDDGEIENIITEDQFLDKTIIFDTVIGGPMMVKVGLIDQGRVLKIPYLGNLLKSKMMTKTAKIKSTIFDKVKNFARNSGKSQNIFSMSPFL